MNENAGVILTAEELDAIGEIMNISMGSSATAVSSMLDRQVTITTPSIQQAQFCDIDSSPLEPAILVKIQYVQGITGTNAIMLRRHDMKIILNLLMGADPDDLSDDDDEFDEMGMSAACEVMNQMMGASATALSEILGRAVNISTPKASLPEDKNSLLAEIDTVDPTDHVVAVSFNIAIKDIMDSSFSCYLKTDLAREMIGAVSGMDPEPVPPPKTEAAQSAIQQQAPPQQMQQPQMEQMQQMQQPQMEQMQPQMQQPQMQQPQMQQPQMQQMQQPQMQQQMGYPPQYGYNMGYPPQAMPDVRQAQFPAFTPGVAGVPLTNANMNLLMNVPLEVSVVIGKARRRIREILDFGQGTIVELDKQTGAPAEIMVNGQLLARGDIIIVGDNFGIRVTEIVSTKEILESLNVVENG